jgi:hypothetical protein
MYGSPHRVFSGRKVLEGCKAVMSVVAVPTVPTGWPKASSICCRRCRSAAGVDQITLNPPLSWGRLGLLMGKLSSNAKTVIQPQRSLFTVTLAAVWPALTGALPMV